MNQKAKLAVLTGLGLAAYAGVANNQVASDDTALDTSRKSEVMQINTNEFEASFLKVSASCKSSHAAFDAVSVGLEEVSMDVIGIHAEVELA